MWCLPAAALGRSTWPRPDRRHLPSRDDGFACSLAPLTYYLGAVDRRRDATQEGERLGNGSNAKDLDAFNEFASPDWRKGTITPVKPPPAGLPELRAGSRVRGGSDCPAPVPQEDVRRSSSAAKTPCAASTAATIASANTRLSHT
jgi:hypothetical protein